MSSSVNRGVPVIFWDGVLISCGCYLEVDPPASSSGEAMQIFVRSAYSFSEMFSDEFSDISGS